MHKSEDAYNSWNKNKQIISKNNKLIKFQQFHIIFIKVGLNIGFEQDGKGNDFLRPVLVYKKFNSRIFLGIPLTSKENHDKFHFEFEYKRGINSYAILSQIKLFDIQRAKYYDGKISKENFRKLQEKMLDLIVTPLKKEGECTKAICDNSISKEFANVNILVTGSSGQLGSEIRELSKNYGYSFIFADKQTLDIANSDNLKEFILSNNINVIINCAAYTAVDKAEQDKENANLINNIAVQNLATIAKELNIKLIHISTDYIFDGTSCKPYTELDSVNPIGVYGKTKLDGEKSMQEINPPNSIIIRTSWVFSSYGTNFVKTMLRLGSEREGLNVVFDQVGTPTYARDLAKAILDILPKIQNKTVEIYNYSNEGVTSWYDFAKEIMKIANLKCAVNPIESKDYPTPTKRPHFSVLNKSNIKHEFNIAIPYWKDSLKECIVKIKGDI